MNNPITLGETMTSRKNLLLLGLGEDPALNYIFSDTTPVCRVVAIDHPFKAFRWLDSCEGDRIPFAIICDYSFLEKEDFQLLKSIKAHAELRYIPVIALREHQQEVDMLAAMKLGVDDCYEKPVSWEIIGERIKFLRKLKAEYPEAITEKEPTFVYRIPPMKRALDLLIAGLGILAISPLLILIAVAIKLESKGPIIYRSKRVGTGYQIFDFLKFRSMYKDADQRLKELQHLNQYAAEEDNAFVKLSNDPRITKIGRLIRNTSLDELPQLFNVIRGEMSIVGNRPLPLYEAELLTKDAWARRFLAPAGITGLWQVTKRGKDDMSTKERMDLDIAYAENFSVWYDIKIILKTFPAMIQKENV